MSHADPQSSRSVFGESGADRCSPQGIVAEIAVQGPRDVAFAEVPIGLLADSQERGGIIPSAMTPHRPAASERLHSTLRRIARFFGFPATR